MLEICGMLSCMDDMGLRNKIGYLVYRARETASTAEQCLEVADAILLLILATPDDAVEVAIASAIPNANRI